MPRDLAPMPRRAMRPRRCSRRSRARPPARSSSRKAWSRRDRDKLRLIYEIRRAMAVKALFFDVFGTLVDWRSGIAREAEIVLRPLGTTLDWLAFADAWRGEYQPGMEGVRAGRIAFCKLDVLHRHH